MYVIVFMRFHTFQLVFKPTEQLFNLIINICISLLVCFYRTNKDFKPIAPTEIVYLRTNTAAHPAPPPGATEVFFEITATDEQFSFDVLRGSHEGMIMGKRGEVYMKLNTLDHSLQHV